MRGIWKKLRLARRGCVCGVHYRKLILIDETHWYLSSAYRCDELFRCVIVRSCLYTTSMWTGGGVAVILPIGGTVALQCDCELNSWNVSRGLARGPAATRWLSSAAPPTHITSITCFRVRQGRLISRKNTSIAHSEDRQHLLQRIPCILCIQLVSTNCIPPLMSSWGFRSFALLTTGPGFPTSVVLVM